jgi:hypothetical protein
MCCPPLFQNEINIGDIMKARILFLVAIFMLPNFLLAQNLYSQPTTSLSLHQKQINSFFINNADLNLIESVNSFKLESNSLRSYCDSTARSLYIFRFAGTDKEDCINFYGLSLGWFHQNPNANFSGLILCSNLGANEQIANNISVNGLNIAVFNTRAGGTINGISISAIGNYARVQNGLQVGIIGAGADYLNGLTLGGFMSQSIEINGIQLSLIINLCKTLNGIGISFINAQSFESHDKEMRKSSGLVIGVFNIVDISGLSIAAINSGNSWLQIGLLNIGDSVVQIGLVNLDENRKMGIPLINVNF